MALKLGYWNIRGLAQPIRFLLEFTGTSWEDVLYCQASGDAPVPYCKKCWLDVKDTLDLDFPNLPYMIDGGVRLTQSKAIMRHVIRKQDGLAYLLGRTAEDAAQVDQLVEEFSDVNGRLTGLQYSRGVDMDFINGDFKRHLGSFSRYLGDKTWFLGDYLTLADFVMFEYLSRSLAYLQAAGLPKYLEEAGFSNLSTFHNGFAALPPIATYLASDRFAAVTAFNNQHAKFR